MSWRTRTILLTGGSGVVGRALIDELAADFDIVCLRHRRPIGDVRVSEFAGDFAHPTLGLPAADYRRLVHRIDAIVHAAAVTSWKQDPADILAANLAGPTAMLRLAAEAGVPLYFYSTAFVVHPFAGADTFPGAAAYLRSKLEAEKLVREHPAVTVIVRPSVISGSTADGSMAAFQGLHRVLGGVVRGRVPLVPCVPESLIDTIPVDLVARAQGRLLREQVATGEFALSVGRNALRVSDFFELCERMSHELGIEVVAPRFLPGEAVERLVLPLLEEALPLAAQQMLRDLLEFCWLFQTPEPLPSSMTELGFTDAITHTALRDATWKTLRYWATAKNLRPETAERVS
ncbi:SDR family oxidoreductase [Nocardia crassostreae]|uniref:SDR family oxidoreductase n=1 Tax=Nocardia crassostreae TaxID=53428 RepID=UPI000A988FBB|nr:SDR family oxidoreductase [Nocardia crassostreae]